MGSINQIGYTSLISFYLKDKSLDPWKALELLDECQQKNKLTKNHTFGCGMRGARCRAPRNSPPTPRRRGSPGVWRVCVCVCVLGFRV